MSMMSLFAASALALNAAAHPGTMANVAQNAEAPVRTDLGDGLYTLVGRGGNILFSVGDDGTFVVDDQFADTAAQNIAAIREVAPGDIEFVLNTHHHGDHTGGNAALAKEGAKVLAHDNVRVRLAENADTTAGLPVITFSDRTTFHWNDREIHVYHMPTAHTDGDALVHFRKANVIHTGDTLFSGLYPYIDLGSGGSVDGYIAALQSVYDLADADTKIVPGHGPLSTKADVLATINMINDARAKVRAEMMSGKDRDGVIAAAPLAELDKDFAWRFITGERFTGTLFDDLMATDKDARAAVGE